MELRWAYLPSINCARRQSVIALLAKQSFPTGGEAQVTDALGPEPKSDSKV